MTTHTNPNAGRTVRVPAGQAVTRSAGIPIGAKLRAATKQQSRTIVRVGQPGEHAAVQAR